MLGDIALWLARGAALCNHVALVLEHDDGLLRRLNAKVGCCGALKDLLGSRTIAVGILKEVNVHHDLGNPARRLPHALQGVILAKLILKELVGFLSNLHVKAAAILVDASINHLLVALWLGEVENTVGLASKDAPVGNKHAIPASVAQDGQVALVVSGANVLSVLLVFGIRDAIAGHH